MNDLDSRLRNALSDAADAVEPVSTAELAAALDDRGPSRPRPTRVRPILAAAAIVAVVATIAVAATRGDDPGSTRVLTHPPTGLPSNTAVTDGPGASTSTTLPAIGTTRGNAVTAWTGREYLVWGGQAGSDGYGRADGWAYDPATGADHPIPVAPMPPLDVAFGAWNGRELVVVGGLVPGTWERTGRAAAYDPSANRWRRLPDIPAGAGIVVGVAAVGDDLYVVTDGPRLFELSPAGDQWLGRSAPQRVDGPTWPVDQIVTGADVLVLWHTGDPGDSPGERYDPASDTWTALPPVPAADRMDYGSAAVAGRWIVAWGSSATDDTRTAGARLHLEDPAAGWQPIANAPLGPIDWGDGTPGSQTLSVDPSTDLLWVVPVTGSESYDADRDATFTGILTYDPANDRWATVPGVKVAGYAPNLTIGRTSTAMVVLLPDVEEPAQFVAHR